jgi:phosphatidylinositol alpha-1,6-mannosyltransferase
VFAGDGSARAALEAQARARGVADRVVFLGSLGASELPVLYAAADVFGLLSRETPGAVEGGGIALLEACSYGVPVVAGASGGIPETITHGETGLLVDPDESDSVVRAFTRVLTDDALAKRLGEAAREMATTSRTWDVFVAQLEDVLRSAAR